LLKEADVPAIPINTLEDVLADEHLNATGFITHYEHPTEGRVQTTGVPLYFEKTPGSPTRRLPPRLGENTRDVLVENGFSNAEIDALLEAGAARQAE
jgi:crotonobetainyl-CoA:carnitine CoA-transferase CaiB-like acyl-CoA transferase